MITTREIAQVKNIKLLSCGNIVERNVALCHDNLYIYDTKKRCYTVIENIKLLQRLKENPLVFKNAIQSYITLELVSETTMNSMHNVMICNINHQSLLLNISSFCEMFCAVFHVNTTVSQDFVDLLQDLLSGGGFDDKAMSIINQIKNNQFLKYDTMVAIATLIGFGTRYIPSDLQKDMLSIIISEYPNKKERHLMFIALESMNNNVVINRLLGIETMVNSFELTNKSKEI